MEAIRRGEIALIPYTPGSDDYIGVDGPPPMDAAAAQRVISGSDYLKGIVALLVEDESQPRSRVGDRDGFDYSIYYTDTFRGFLDARREYMARFNSTIEKHLGARPDSRADRPEYRRGSVAPPQDTVLLDRKDY